MQNLTGKNLSLVELARCAAFFDALRLIEDESNARGIEQPKLNETALSTLQELTVTRSNKYAEKFGVSFPDETERETLPLAERDAMESTPDEIEMDEPANVSESDVVFFQNVSESDVREVFESVED